MSPLSLFGLRAYCEAMEGSAFGLSLAIVFGFTWGVAVTYSAINFWSSRPPRVRKIRHRRTRIHRHV